MPSRNKFIIANWKMNKDAKEASEFVSELEDRLKGLAKAKAVVAAPFVDLPQLKDLGLKKIKLAAQNLYPGEKGAFTGEVSGLMLKSLVSYVILGHSERRRQFGDNDKIVNQKIKSSLFYNLKPIICFGETLEQKEDGQSRQVIEQQLAVCLDGLKDEDINKCLLVYEPIWAISSTPGSTGEGDDPTNAQVMHKLVRHFVATKFSEAIAGQIPILYGGSVNLKNAEDLLKMPDIDGGLVGKASLQIDSFFEIIEIASKIN